MEEIKRALISLQKIRTLLDKKVIRIIMLNCIFLILMSASTPIVSYLYKIIIDYLSSDLSLAILCIIAYAFVQLGEEILEHIKNQLDLKINYAINNNLLKSISKKMSKIKLEELEKPQTFDYLDRVYKNVASNAINLINTLLGIISPIVVVIIYAMILVSIKWYFPIIIIVSNFPYFLMIWKKTKENYDQEVDLNKKSRRLEYLTDILTNRQNAKEIRIFKLVNFFNEKISNLRKDIMKKQIKLIIKYSLFDFLINILRNFSLGICLFVTCYDILYNYGKVGNLVLVISALQSIVDNITSLFTSVSSLNRCALYLNDWTELDNLPENSYLKQKHISDCNIKLQNVSFRYPNTENYVLKNINLEIAPKQKIAIVGENGSGKSTLINLLLGNYEVTEGKILIDENSLWEVIDEFRKITVPIFQNYIKYQLSVEENLMAGNYGEALHLTNLGLLDFNKFIDSLPDGLQTQLGQLDQNAYELSGGEWQKIAIFRALSRKHSKIFIMDEPTSSLDPIIENKIYEDFSSICEGKTVILISHRLSAAKLCDKIILLDKGSIIEQGSHNELMQLQGKYYKMFSMQKHFYL